LSKRNIVLILLVALLAICAGQAFAQQPKPPVTVTLAQGVALGTVTMPHKAHVDGKVACTVCHHASKAAKPAKSAFEKCTDCHTKTGTPEVKVKLQAAFHNPAASAGLCIDCHKKAVAAGNAKAPTKCMQCHKKS